MDDTPKNIIVQDIYAADDDDDDDDADIAPEDLICRRCNHRSTTKCNLLSHLRRKKPCKVVSENISIKAYIEELLKKPEQEPRRYSCSFCNYQFNTRQSKSRHMKTCRALRLKNTPEAQVTESTEVVTSDVSVREGTSYINQKDLILTTELQQKNSIIEDMKVKMDDMKVKMDDMKEIITDLKLEIAFLKNKKNEQFYQEIMEKHFNAAHKTLNIGITDITTDDAHYEIKRWSCWKEALAQLQLYNDEDPKEHLYACFFETCTDNHKEKVQNSLNKYNIECLEFHQDESGINLSNLKNKTIVFTYKVEQSDT